MGFAIFPDPPKEGVWMFKKTGDLILITGAGGLFMREIFYKPRQRRPRLIMDGVLERYFEWLGYLDETDGAGAKDE